jgi:hypothetical protein
MSSRGTYILAGLGLASALCWADLGAGSPLSVAEYRAELDELQAATQQFDSSGSATPSILQHLPQSWRVHTGRRDFEISTEGLGRRVRRYDQDKSASNASAVRAQIENLRSDLDGFETSPADVSSSRQRLAALLARREFRDVRGPTFADRLREKLLTFFIRALEFLFRASSIPTISKIFVYGLIGLAVLTLGFIAYRHIKSAGAQESVVPSDVPVSAKSWPLWLAEANAAAAQHNWREAIHLAYWAGISFLEQQGAWRPDRARTPREYLRLLASSSEHRETLGELTQVFELTWYAKRGADAGVFSQTVRALEKMGCR